MRLTHRPASTLSPRRRPTPPAAAPSRPPPPPPPPSDDADEALLLADLERYSGAGGATRGPSSSPSSPARPAASSSSDPPNPAWKDALDKLLVADFFFVLLALAWLVVGVGVRAGGGSPAIADTWLALWPSLFQPAIGLLMAGALVSGAGGWLAEKKGEE